MNSVLDFAFQGAASSFAGGGKPTGLSTLFAGDDRYTTPDSSATALPTFLGNHDMGRIGHFLSGKGDVLQRDRLAHELMFLTRGQPVIYYGDEQGFAGNGGDRAARQSLFASQVAEYTEQSLVTGETVGAQDRYDTEAPLYTDIAALSQLRADHPTLTTGA
ncbi:alpha-amylase family glycosyl hydrolase, partial [Brevundimonas mediterranea]